MNIEDIERAALKEKADLLGIEYHPNISNVKLNERIQAKLNIDNGSGQVVKDVLSGNDALREARLDATRLVRIRISCMNPAKKDWQGEVFTCGNTTIGSHTKFVPFNVDWHVPNVIYKMIRRRKYQQFVKVNEGERSYKKSVLAREFTIEVLPALTGAELKQLAAKQAAANGTPE